MFDRASKVEPKECAVWFLWAIAENEISNTIRDDYFELAIECSKDQEQEKILSEYGKILANAKRHRDSVAVFTKLVKSNSYNKGAFHMLGKSYYEIGKNQFMKYSRLNIEIKAGEPIVNRKLLDEKRNLRESMLWNYGKSKEAFLKSLYDTVNNQYEISTNVVGLLYLAKIARYNFDYKTAKSYIDQALKLRPMNPRLIEFRDQIEDILCKKKQEF